MPFTAQQKKEWAEKKYAERDLAKAEGLVKDLNKADIRLANAIKELIAADFDRNTSLRMIDTYYRNADLHNLKYNHTPVDYSESWWNADRDTEFDHEATKIARAKWQVENMGDPKYKQYFEDLTQDNLKSISESRYPSDYSKSLKQAFSFVDDKGKSMSGTVEFNIDDEKEATR